MSSRSTLLPELLDVVEALADIERRHEAHCERLARWPIPNSIKTRMLDRLERHRRHEREPRVRCLTELQQRSMALSADDPPPGLTTKYPFHKRLCGISKQPRRS
jgi:hypothetical protein